jgi:hypothetical protein
MRQACLVSSSAALLTRQLELAIALAPDLALATRELVVGCDEVDGAVESHGVVMGDELLDGAPGLLERGEGLDAQRIGLVQRSKRTSPIRRRATLTLADSAG